MSQKLDLMAPPEGTVLVDKYRVSRVLGQGGMGVVLAAEHLGLGNQVAIKVMRPELVDKENIVKRFMFEGKAATRLQSDHVARVLDVGRLTGEGIREDGVPYLVMEFLKGNDLSHFVRAGKRFELQEAISFIVQAADGLKQAHKAGIIHRDVKPANMFLHERPDAEPIVKILDFGISKLLDEQPAEMGLTKTTAVLGSGLYMSPEQMRSAKNVDQRTDIYALGVCLYELLTGTQPFVAETFSELCVKVNVEDPTPLSEYRPDISSEVAAAIERAYAREVDDRYQNIDEMVAALAPFADTDALSRISRICGGSIPAPPPVSAKPLASTVSATASDPGRSRAKIGMVMALGALVGVAAVGIFAARDAPSSSGPAATVDVTDHEGPAAAASSSAPASASVMPSASASAAPSASASAAPSALASAAPSASTSAKPVTKPVTPIRRPVRRWKPKPRPPAKPCFKKNSLGLKVPC